MPATDETDEQRCAFVVDLTEEMRSRKMEPHLAAIAGVSFDPLIAQDLDGAVTFWNPATEKMFGYTAEEAVGKPALFLVPENTRSDEDGAIRRVLAEE